LQQRYKVTCIHIGLQNLLADAGPAAEVIEIAGNAKDRDVMPGQDAGRLQASNAIKPDHYSGWVWRWLAHPLTSTCS
jgi:hypothetical protein